MSQGRNHNESWGHVAPASLSVCKTPCLSPCQRRSLSETDPKVKILDPLSFAPLTVLVVYSILSLFSYLSYSPTVIVFHLLYNLP
jgi:hypothetical protein